MSSLSFLSLNLWNINEPMGQRLQIVSDFILRNRVDVVFFQEVPVLGHELVLPDALLSDCYTIHHFFTGYWGHREEGIAICTRGPSTLVSAVPLSGTRNENLRGLLVSRVLMAEGPSFLVANSHLSYRTDEPEVRARQAVEIRKVLTDLWTRLKAMPVVFCGDLNSVPEEGVVDRIAGRKANGPYFYDIQARVGMSSLDTFSSSNPYASDELLPGRRIDYALATPHWQVESFELVFNTERQGYASDHFGLSFRLSMD